MYGHDDIDCSEFKQKAETQNRGMQPVRVHDISVTRWYLINKRHQRSIVRQVNHTVSTFKIRITLRICLSTVREISKKKTDAIEW